MALRQCLQCGQAFTFKREDHFFCSGKCVAAFYRENPNPNQIHRDLPHDRPHVCEWCGNPYHTNAYAERGGKRAPKYCSGKCKQAAYRARGQGTQEQARRRYEGSSQENTHQSDRTHREERQQHRQHHEEPRRRTAGSTGMTAQRAWQVLGVSPNAPIGAIKQAYRNTMRRFHPDVYKGPDATARAQEINAAYEYLKKYRA